MTTVNEIAAERASRQSSAKLTTDGRNALRGLLRAASLDAGDNSGQYAEVDSLEDLLTRHRAAPFPESITKGLDYGEVDAVMIDSDIYGWASKASSGRLSPTDRVTLQAARDRLDRSLGPFP